jgi:hypothetical protein
MNPLGKKKFLVERPKKGMPQRRNNSLEKKKKRKEASKA